MNFFVGDVSVIRVPSSRTRFPILGLKMFFHTFSDLCKINVENLGKVFFKHAQVGNNNVHDITHGKIQVELGVNVLIRLKGQSYCSWYHRCTFNNQQESLKCS